MPLTSVDQLRPASRDSHAAARHAEVEMRRIARVDDDGVRLGAVGRAVLHRAHPLAELRSSLTAGSGAQLTPPSSERNRPCGEGAGVPAAALAGVAGREPEVWSTERAGAARRLAKAGGLAASLPRAAEVGGAEDRRPEVAGPGGGQQRVAVARVEPQVADLWPRCGPSAVQLCAWRRRGRSRRPCAWRGTARRFGGVVFAGGRGVPWRLLGDLMVGGSVRDDRGAALSTDCERAAPALRCHDEVTVNARRAAPERMRTSPLWQARPSLLSTRCCRGLRRRAPRPTLSEFSAPRGGCRSSLPAVNPLEGWRRPAGSGLRATWLGHSTVLIEIDGWRVLTDRCGARAPRPRDWPGPSASSRCR